MGVKCSILKKGIKEKRNFYPPHKAPATNTQYSLAHSIAEARHLRCSNNNIDAGARREMEKRVFSVLCTIL